jgi:hypothetical protein
MSHSKDKSAKGVTRANIAVILKFSLRTVRHQPGTCLRSGWKIIARKIMATFRTRQQRAL